MLSREIIIRVKGKTFRERILFNCSNVFDKPILNIQGTDQIGNQINFENYDEMLDFILEHTVFYAKKPITVEGKIKSIDENNNPIYYNIDVHNDPVGEYGFSSFSALTDEKTNKIHLRTSLIGQNMSADFTQKLSFTLPSALGQECDAITKLVERTYVDIQKFFDQEFSYNLQYEISNHLVKILH